jgi:uncharacterized tellurite resistance protein B-like protein
MTFTDFVTSNGKRINKEAFVHLVQVSKADGKISKPALRLLHKEGKKFGLTEPEIDHFIQSEGIQHYHAPYSMEEKFEHLYNVTEMILADCEMTEKEKKMIKRFVIEIGFTDRVLVNQIINMLLCGIKRKDSEENLYKEFRKIVFAR